MITSPTKFLISNTSTIRECMIKLDQTGNLPKTLFVKDSDDKLVGSVTDGDIRRAFLAGISMDSQVKEICTRHPIVAPEGMEDEAMNQLIIVNKINCLPIVDKNGNIVNVKAVSYEEYKQERVEIVAVIMAGGYGKRLGHLTKKIPKPMLKVHGKPLLQIVIESLSRVGIRKIYINIRYLGEVIKDYFKDGLNYGVEIKYIVEPKPMGTAGSLGIIPKNLRPKSAILVLNGDLLTTLNFRTFYDFHINAKYDFTLCGRPYEVKIPFGYPVVEGDIVTAFREKPTFTHYVNSGIYCINPSLINKVPDNGYFDMPDLIKAAINSGARVGVFPLREEFLEIGRPESYMKAEQFYRLKILQKGREK